jgi:hypothetical protein
MTNNGLMGSGILKLKGYSYIYIYILWCIDPGVVKHLPPLAGVTTNGHALLGNGPVFSEFPSRSYIMRVYLQLGELENCVEFWRVGTPR